MVGRQKYWNPIWWANSSVLFSCLVPFDRYWIIITICSLYQNWRVVTWSCILIYNAIKVVLWARLSRFAYAMKFNLKVFNGGKVLLGEDPRPSILVISNHARSYYDICHANDDILFHNVIQKSLLVYWYLSPGSRNSHLWLLNFEIFPDVDPRPLPGLFAFLFWMFNIRLL